MYIQNETQKHELYKYREDCAYINSSSGIDNGRYFSSCLKHTKIIQKSQKNKMQWSFVWINVDVTYRQNRSHYKKKSLKKWKRIVKECGSFTTATCFLWPRFINDRQEMAREPLLAMDRVAKKCSHSSEQVPDIKKDTHRTVGQTDTHTLVKTVLSVCLILPEVKTCCCPHTLSISASGNEFLFW